MFSSPTKFFLNILFIFLSFAVVADAQTPTPSPQDDTERIFTEEIKLNVTAFGVKRFCPHRTCGARDSDAEKSD